MAQLGEAHTACAWDLQVGTLKMPYYQDAGDDSICISITQTTNNLSYNLSALNTHQPPVLEDDDAQQAKPVLFASCCPQHVLNVTRRKAGLNNLPEMCMTKMLRQSMLAAAIWLP